MAPKTGKAGKTGKVGAPIRRAALLAVCGLGLFGAWPVPAQAAPPAVGVRAAAAAAATTTTLTPSANPSPAGRALTLRAQVRGAAPTGAVQFKDGAADLGAPVPLINGQATLDVTPATAAGHVYGAAYPGDPGNAPSAAQATVNVTAAPTTTTLTASPAAATPATAVTLTATIQGAGPPGGAVTFFDGATALHTVPVVGGQATWRQTLADGLHPLAARYAGDAGHATSTSTPALVHVGATATAPATAALQWSYQYDAQGHLTQAVDANAATTRPTWDGLARPVKIASPAPAPGQAAPVVQLGHDLRDQPTTVTDPRGLTTAYSSDGLGNTTAQSSPDTGLTTATFYDDGLLHTRRDARGRTATFTYDALDRPKTITFDGGVGTTFTYDETAGGNAGRGHLTTMVDESGTTRWSYDGLGRVTSKTQTTGPAAPPFTIATTWGTTGPATGKPQTIRYPSGARIRYGYDAAGRVDDVQVTGADGVVTPILSGLSYTAAHQPRSWAWGVGGVVSQRGFDGNGRLVSYPLGNPAGTGASAGVMRTLGVDAAGRIIGYSHTPSGRGDQRFSLDGLDRLTAATPGAGNAGNAYGYAYDASGNRTQSTINGTTYASTVSATSNRLTNVATAAGAANAQTYDAAGHLSGEGQGGTETYSARGRLSRQARDGHTVSYLINGLEQRTVKTGPSAVVPTGTAYYVHDDAGRLVGEYDASGQALYETVYLGDLPIAVLTQPALNQTTVSYVYADHLNTARVIVRPADQAILWRWDSPEPFGQTPPDANPNGLGVFTYSPRFPGQVADAESGWFHNGYRDYD
ncbi:MAG: Ig-like domain repeat protein, partial [Burkholderiaceae bacterium]